VSPIFALRAEHQPDDESDDYADPEVEIAVERQVRCA
jgi:hypothetical protein